MSSSFPKQQQQQQQPLFAAPIQQQQQAYSADNLQFYSSSYAGAAQQPPVPQTSSQQPPQYSSGYTASATPAHQSSNSGYVSQPMFGPHPGPAGGISSSSANRMFVGSPFGTGGYSDEPPLLEELGVNFSHITSKSVSVLNVFRTPDKHIMDDTDLAGPIFFCILFGVFLLLSGKVHFGYIYGVATVGCLSMLGFLNLMSENGIDGYRTASVLGYSLLPMVVLSILAALLQLNGLLGLVLCVCSILWCTYSASTMFVTVLSMKDQRFLVAYPIGLLYAAFALLTVF